MKTPDSICEIPIAKIHLGRNPRTNFDNENLQSLAQSIRKRGLKQPIVVEPDRGGYLLVMGERRLRSHQLLGKTHITAIVRARSNHNGRERFLDALLENQQREEMTPMDTARAYQVLNEEYLMSVRQISQKIGKTEKAISDLLILTKLDEEIQQMIDQGFWKDPRLARGLLNIKDSGTRVALARRLFKNKVSLKSCLVAVERTQRAVKESARAKKIDPKSGTPSLQLAEAQDKPLRWDMLRQVGKLPAWELVVVSAERTCQACPLRSNASRFTCADCGAVDMLRRLMEVGSGTP